MRFPDWRTRLQNYISANIARPFQAGVFDCSLFSADCVNVMTGVDHAAPYRGQYSTIQQGLTLLQADGFADHEAFVASKFIITASSPYQLSAGDLAVVEQRGLKGIGVVLGSSIAVVTLGRGIGQLPLSQAKRGFIVT